MASTSKVEGQPLDHQAAAASPSTLLHVKDLVAWALPDDRGLIIFFAPASASWFLEHDNFTRPPGTPDTSSRSCTTPLTTRCCAWCRTISRRTGMSARSPSFPWCRGSTEPRFARPDRGWMSSCARPVARSALLAGKIGAGRTPTQVEPCRPRADLLYFASSHHALWTKLDSTSVPGAFATLTSHALTPARLRAHAALVLRLPARRPAAHAGTDWANGFSAARCPSVHNYCRPATR